MDTGALLEIFLKLQFRVELFKHFLAFYSRYLQNTEGSFNRKKALSHEVQRSLRTPGVASNH